MTQTITVGSWPGKRLACFVDGVRVFHMHKSQHKEFNRRVELLRAQARTSDAAAIDAMFALLSVSLTVALRIERREAQPRVERWLSEQRLRLRQPTIEYIPTPEAQECYDILDRIDHLDAIISSALGFAPTA